MPVVSIALSDIKEAISRSLESIAKPDGIKDEAGNRFKRGIDIMHSQRKPHMLRIRFLSKEDFLICIDFNCKEMSHSYLSNMMGELKKQIEHGKMVRHQENKITLLNPARTR